MFGIRKKNGWVGIDAGASTLKLAQVRRQGSQLSLEHAVIVPRASAWHSDTEEFGCSFQEIESAIAIAGELGGARAAATLSMAVCDVVAGRAAQPLAIAVGGAQATKYCTDEWQADTKLGDEGWYTFSLQEAIADDLCRDLSRSGLSCRTIDAMTHTLARAVAIHDPDSRRRTVATLDWGHSGAMLCSVRDGAPVYVRRLKGCGLRALEEAVCDELEIDRIAACELMAKAAGDAEGPAAQLIADLAVPLVDRLADDLGRTLTHLKSHRKSLMPEKIFLFGGGATIGAAQKLAKCVERPVMPWAPPGIEPADGISLAMLGPAIALSALAWEES
ncbi:MAG: hypothetical protein AAGF31_08865 [Planctomycetota bacterium]